MTIRPAVLYTSRNAILGSVIALALVTGSRSVSFAQLPTPQIASVVNAASYVPASPMAPGVIFTIFGSSLTDGRTASADLTPLPTRLAGAAVLVNGAAASLFYVSPGQINAQFPVEASGAISPTIVVQVQSSGGTATSPPRTVLVKPASPGIFTWDQTGSGPGAILRNSDFTKICPNRRTDCDANYAAAGDALAIYVTGLGEVNGPWVSGQVATVASPVFVTPRATIGGVPAQVAFAGLSP